MNIEKITLLEETDNIFKTAAVDTYANVNNTAKTNNTNKIDLTPEEDVEDLSELLLDDDALKNAIKASSSPQSSIKATATKAAATTTSASNTTLKSNSSINYTQAQIDKMTLSEVNTAMNKISSELNKAMVNEDNYTQYCLEQQENMLNAREKKLLSDDYAKSQGRVVSASELSLYQYKLDIEFRLDRFEWKMKYLDQKESELNTKLKNTTTSDEKYSLNQQLNATKALKEVYEMDKSNIQKQYEDAEKSLKVYQSYSPTSTKSSVSTAELDEVATKIADIQTQLVELGAKKSTAMQNEDEAAMKECAEQEDKLNAQLKELYIKQEKIAAKNNGKELTASELATLDKKLDAQFALQKLTEKIQYISYKKIDITSMKAMAKQNKDNYALQILEQQEYALKKIDYYYSTQQAVLESTISSRTANASVYENVLNSTNKLLNTTFTFTQPTQTTSTPTTGTTGTTTTGSTGTSTTGTTGTTSSIIPGTPSIWTQGNVQFGSQDYITQVLGIIDATSMTNVIMDNFGRVVSFVDKNDNAKYTVKYGTGTNINITTTIVDKDGTTYNDEYAYTGGRLASMKFANADGSYDIRTFSGYNEAGDPATDNLEAYDKDGNLVYTVADNYQGDFPTVTDWSSDNAIIRFSANDTKGVTIAAGDKATIDANGNVVVNFADGRIWRYNKAGEKQVDKSFSFNGKGILLKDGVKYTGVYEEDGKCYKKGKPYTGKYNAVYYQKGVWFTGIKSGKYYKNGLPSTGTYDGKYYVNGKAFTGEANGILYKKGKPYTGTKKGYFFVDGKVYTGVYKNKKYENGKRVA